jgi:hypothetical protein
VTGSKNFLRKYGTARILQAELIRGSFIKRLHYCQDLRKFKDMKTFVSAVGFRHLRRSWKIIPGWVAS